MRGDPVDVLAAECEAVSSIVLGLAEDDFARPTRCPPWDVKVLLGHMWRDVDRIVSYAEEPAPEAATVDAVSYWRSYDPVREGALISARTYEVADRFATGTDLARSFDEALDEEPWITRDASAVTREILVGLMGSEPPATLGWDDLGFIESGTGRRPLGDGERDVLGPIAAMFPLLA